MAASGANRGPGTDASDLGRVEHAVALIVAETEQPVEVYDAVLKAIGEALGWRLGAVWEVDPRTRRLSCARTWHAGERPQEFEALSGALTLSPGVGLPGRVLESGQPAWLVDAPEDANFPRAQAAQRGGLHAGFAFPLRSPRGVVGVMEFFTGELREPDHRLLATMDTLGSQIGQFVAGLRAAEELRARESRLSAMLDAALDAVVTMDAAAGSSAGTARRRRPSDTPRARPTGARWPSSSCPSTCAMPIATVWRATCRPSAGSSSTAGWSSRGRAATAPSSPSS